jgi:hypothetical protein
MSSTNAIIINTNNTTFDEDEVTSKYTPHKMSAWDSFKGFWMTHHNLRRYPFEPSGTPVKTANKSAWTSLKEFFQQRQKFGRHPFATQV